MKYAVRVSSVLLAAIVFGLCYLQALQQQTLLPLDTNARGFMNFATSSLSPGEVREHLERFGAEEGLEIYQITSPSATLHTDVYARGGRQLATAEEITWLQPGKTGTVYPADQSPPDLVSGVYVLKGSDASIQRLKDWATQIGVIHDWEKISFLMLVFLPVIYQGVALTLFVTIVLMASVVLAWYVKRSETRAMRVLGGVPTGRIHAEDTAELVRLILIPSAITTALAIGLAAVFKGLVAGKLVIPAAALLLLSYLAVTIFGLLISVLTWPTTANFAHRIPASTKFSWVSSSFLYATTIILVACVPFVQLTLERTSDNEKAAHTAAKLPTYYSINFGLVLNHERDYDSKVPGMAAITSAMERDGQVAYLRYEETPELKDSGFTHIAFFNEQYFQDLTATQPQDSFQEIPAESVPPEAQKAVVKQISQSGKDTLKFLRFFTPAGDGRVVAIRGAGIFESHPKTLIVVIPRVTDVLQPEYIVSFATAGSILYRDRDRIMSEASKVGVNLTLDNASDTIRLYANDQRLGFQVTVFSTIALGLAFAVLVVVSGAICALRNARRLLPRYLQGATWPSLLRGRIAMDAAVILAACGLSTAICIGLEFYGPLIPTLLLGVVLITGSILSRRIQTRSVLIDMIQRKD